MTARIGRRGFLSALAALPVLGLTHRRVWADNGVIQGAVHEVGIKGMAFAPARIAVRVGDSIRWTNADIVPHTASATDGGWDTGPIKKGESVTVEVSQSMTSTYKCRFHPKMTGGFEIVAA